MDLITNRVLYKIFEEYALKQGEKDFLLFEKDPNQIVKWTYSEFLNDVKRVILYLTDIGITKGEVITIHMENNPVHILFELAASYMGVIVLPTDPSCTEYELEYFITHSESKMVVVEPSKICLVEKLSKKINIRTITLAFNSNINQKSKYFVIDDDLKKYNPSSLDIMNEQEHTSIVMYLYTSGTTSNPKAVMISNAVIEYGARVLSKHTNLVKDDRHLISLPLFHAAAQFHALWPSIVSGASIVLTPRFSASRFFEQAYKYNVSVAALFGAPLRFLLNQPKRDFDNMHNLRNITFAQSLTDSMYKEWKNRFKVPLQQLWGMTETVGLPIMSPISLENRNLKAMGKSVIGYECRIISEEDENLSWASEGQLIVKCIPGLTAMSGYYKEIKKTKEIFREIDDSIWLFSGDTVSVDTEGFFYFLDRGKDLIKRGGENISTIQVESIIMEIPDVIDVCVTSTLDSFRDEKVVAAVVLKENSNITSEIIKDYCNKKLSSFKVPSEIIFVKALPRTSVGKIQKEKVKKFFN